MSPEAPAKALPHDPVYPVYPERCMVSQKGAPISLLSVHLGKRGVFAALRAANEKKSWGVLLADHTSPHRHGVGGGEDKPRNSRRAITSRV